LAPTKPPAPVTSALTWEGLAGDRTTRPVMIVSQPSWRAHLLCCREVTPSATTGSLGQLTERCCPSCGSTDDSRIFAEQHLDMAALDEHAFASRKRPELMRLRLVDCPVCDLVYASPVPSPDALAQAYEAAAFDSAEEARYAARSYAEQLEDIFATLPDRRGAIDIGTGEGAFLAELLKRSFTDVAGVEPSSAPIAAADADIAELIEHGVFHPRIRPPDSLSLATCFQTIEHVPDPAELVRGAAALLKPGGVLAIVCHDRRAPLNRALGLRSPIVDIEHMQLFSPRSIGELLRGAGLRDVGHRPIRNRYPIRYWARLSPLPERVQTVVSGALERSGVGARPLTMPVGNLLAWGVRS
jgi:SAM-dependent methyltransferase